MSRLLKKTHRKFHARPAMLRVTSELCPISLFTKAIAVLSLSIFIQTCYGQQPKVLAPHVPVPPLMTKPVPYPNPAILRSMVGGLWMTDGNMRSAIHLKNSLATSSLTVIPILYLANGTKIQLAAVTLEPSGTAIVSVNDSLASNGIAPYAQLFGYVEVQYTWPWDAICVTVRNIDVAHSLLFNYGIGNGMSASSAAVSAPATQTLQGMWWKELPQETGFVALSNPTSNPQVATVIVNDNSSTIIGQHTVTISPNGTKLVNLDELQNSVGTAGGISVSFQGSPKTILVAAALEEPSAGYSANIPFADVHATRTDDPTTLSLAQLGLMAGAADPMMLSSWHLVHSLFGDAQHFQPAHLRLGDALLDARRRVTFCETRGVHVTSPANSAA
jgi:hypothetical protein